MSHIASALDYAAIVIVGSDVSQWEWHLYHDVDVVSCPLTTRSTSVAFACRPRVPSFYKTLLASRRQRRSLSLAQQLFAGRHSPVGFLEADPKSQRATQGGPRQRRDKAYHRKLLLHRTWCQYCKLQFFFHGDAPIGKMRRCDIKYMRVRGVTKSCKDAPAWAPARDLMRVMPPSSRESPLLE